MKHSPFWIGNSPDSRIAIISRPRGGDWLADELAALRNQGIDIVVSLLSGEEIFELGLADEARFAQQEGMDYFNYSIPDRGLPESRKDFMEFLQSLAGEHQAGKRIGIHCRASIGRSSITAALLLSLTGHDRSSIWSSITDARGCEVPDTREQKLWVTEILKSIP